MPLIASVSDILGVMPSIWHDTVNELFKRRPEFGAEILRDLMGEDPWRNS